jgi:hypothetical protein
LYSTGSYVRLWKLKQKGEAMMVGKEGERISKRGMRSTYRAVARIARSDAIFFSLSASYDRLLRLF